MKTKILNTIGIIALAATVNTAAAQTSVPNTFSYQAVITAEDGSPVSNHDITVEVSIRQGNDCETNPDCKLLWQELHAPKTNDFGSFSIEIGSPNAISTTNGSETKYSNIDWLNTTNGNYYMQVRVDFGEASYLNGMTDLGTTKFSAVPYALATSEAEHAKTADGIQITNGKIANTLKQLADVDIQDNNPPADGQFLRYRNGKWVNESAENAQGLTNINISTPKTGDHLVYNESNSKWENKPIATLKLNDLEDVTSSTLKDGYVLTYDATGKLWKAAQPATSGDKVTKLAELTGDVKITNPKKGQVLKLVENNGKTIWQNEDPTANDVWKTSGTNIYRNASYVNVGIGTDEPATLLDISAGGDNRIMLNGHGITMGTQQNRCSGTGIIAMGGTRIAGEISKGTACIVGNGSYVNNNVNTIVMGKNSYSSGGGEGIIIIGDNNSATGDFSALFGEGLSALVPNQFICGSYNNPTSAAAFIIGNGRPNDLSNLFVINNDGTATLSGASLSSDSRLKTRITTMPNALDDLLKLRGVTFLWNKATKPNASDKTQYGFIAQEVESVFPDLVGTDSNGYKTVNYIGVIPVLTEAIKTQQDEIKELKSENEQLKSTLEQLLKRVEALEKNK